MIKENIPPYDLDENEHNNTFIFSQNDITISGSLPHIKNKYSTCTVIYETEDEFYGIKLNNDHFEKFAEEPIDNVLNAFPMEREFKDKIFVNFESFFGHFSKTNFNSIIEGLTYFTKFHQEYKGSCERTPKSD